MFNSEGVTSGREAQHNVSRPRPASKELSIVVLYKHLPAFKHYVESVALEDIYPAAKAIFEILAVSALHQMSKGQPARKVDTLNLMPNIDERGYVDAFKEINEEGKVEIHQATYTTELIYKSMSGQSNQLLAVLAYLITLVEEDEYQLTEKVGSLLSIPQRNEMNDIIKLLNDIEFNSDIVNTLWPVQDELFEYVRRVRSVEDAQVGSALSELLNYLYVALSVMGTISPLSNELSRNALATYVNKGDLRKVIAAYSIYLKHNSDVFFYAFKEDVQANYLLALFAVKIKDEDAGLVSELLSKINPMSVKEYCHWISKNGTRKDNTVYDVIKHMDHVNSMERIERIVLNRSLKKSNIEW